MTQITPIPGITPYAAAWLARQMKPADRVECGLTGQTPYALLIEAPKLGPCWTLIDRGQTIGAGGFTTETRLIWSYFLPLTPEQSTGVMLDAVAWIKALVVEAGPGFPLHNVVWAGNLAAVSFIRATHCFDMGSEAESAGTLVIPFFAKPLEDMPNV